MFVGEIEFGELPVKGGNVSQSLAHMYILTFVFFMAIVLMNLLNGMAVSDIGRILKKSEVIGQLATIDTIAYTESVLLNNLTTLQTIGRAVPCILVIVQKILIGSGVMLFESKYMKGREELILPLQASPQDGMNMECE